MDNYFKKKGETISTKCLICPKGAFRVPSILSNFTCPCLDGYYDDGTS